MSCYLSPQYGHVILVSGYPIPKKYTVNQGCMSLCQPVFCSMAAMLRDSAVVFAAVVRTRPRAIPLAVITMRKSTHGFPFVSHIWIACWAPLLFFRFHMDINSKISGIELHV